MTQEEAVAVVAKLLASQELRPESLYALAQAANVARIEGMGGVLVVKIPRKQGQPLDVQFTTGQAGIRLEF